MHSPRSVDVGGTAPPLCPAGHLPHGWGDRPSPRLPQISSVTGRAPTSELPIYSLVGQMSGRTEEGAKDRDRTPVPRATNVNVKV
ncbi:MAG: lytic murein transglycosylase [Mesorhizobium sp.]|nr:MAG: lytic murein transglycosylase [Mesorhizobium sp.]TIX24561.1 MAG: lytic murein transglycosylase [Mesorhizobium sp.]